MMLRAAAVFATILVLGFTAPAALAIGEDVFVVPRVTVQAQADSATAAKARAQAQGRRRAIDILLRRLTMEEDWQYLPRMAAPPPEPAEGEAEAVDPLAADPALPGTADPLAALAPPAPVGPTVITLTDRDREELESGFEVYNEKSSPRTYRAFITYRFKPAAVRRLLRDAQVPYSEAQTRTALVLPVLQTANDIYLWEDNNPWMAAWKVRPYNNELTPMIAPLGDLEDAAAITPRQALALDKEALQGMAARYSVSQVIVAHAYLRQTDDGQDRLRVRLINGFRESGEVDRLEGGGLPGLDAGGLPPTANQFPQSSFGQAPADFMPAKDGDILSETWFRRPSGNFPTLAENAIETAIAKHATPWKRQTLIDHTEAALLEASAYFNSIGEWSQIRTALVSTPLIGSIQVKALSRRGAEMLVRAYGDPGKLIVAMEAQGLTLWTEDGERWLIATPSTAQGVRGAARSDARVGERDGDRRRGFFGGGRDDDALDNAAPPGAESDPQGGSARIDSRYQ